MEKESKKDLAKKAIDKKNSEAAKADLVEISRNANAPNPGFQKFTQVKGVKDKAKVVAESAGSSAKIKNTYSAATAAKYESKKKKSSVKGITIKQNKQNNF